MSVSASYKYDVKDHIFVQVSNATVYKTQILDRRSFLSVGETTHIRKEYQVKNTSQDSPKICWVEEEKCFSIHEIMKIISLDS